MQSKIYNGNFLSNVHWRYYVFNKEYFFQSLSLLDVVENKKDKSATLSIIDTLLLSIEKDYARVKSDSNFFLFMRYVNNDDSASKYVDLYYNLTKSKLTGLKDCINQNGFNFSLDELNEYYVRYKASAFFKEAWFYVTKYHATDVFFKLFIDDEIFNHFTTPDKSTNYLEKDMYLNIVLKRDDAEKIIRNVSVKKIDTNDFLLNDSIFYEGLQGFINDKYILVYGND